MTVNTPVVTSGAPIVATWGNTVRTDLLNLDAGKLSLSGGTMTGTLYGTHLNMSGNMVAGGNIYAGKSGADHAVAGCEVRADGPISVTTGVASQNIYLTRIGTQEAAGGQYIRFGRTTAQTGIGSITIATSSAVAYNTTSDKRLKTLTRSFDPNEIMQKVLTIEPVHFRWTDDHEAIEQLGFFAQDLYPIAPEVVTPGDESEPGEDGFTPWMADNAKLVPLLVAAIQILTDRITALEGAAP
jgi:hypothetical protein